MLLKSIIKENFLSDSELTSISETVYSYNKIYDDIINDFQFSEYYIWEYYKSQFSNIKEILHEKLTNLIGSDMIIDHSHILSSSTPYNVHTDYFQQKNFPFLEPAYTLIIPLDNFDSNTIAFEQNSTIKSFREYLETEPRILSDEKRISQDFIDKYLSHIDPKYFDYLSLKEIFPWKKGNLYACDRKYFHTSDNYHTRGVERKQALVFWTSVKK